MTNVQIAAFALMYGFIGVLVYILACAIHGDPEDDAVMKIDHTPKTFIVAIVVLLWPFAVLKLVLDRQP